MPSFKTVIIIVAIVFAFQRKAARLATAARLAPAEKVLVSLCSNQVSPQYSSLAMAETASLINLIPNNGYSYHIFNAFNVNGQGLPYWGHGACNGQVQAGYCNNCLVEALYYLNNCIGKTGGQVKLTNCRLRYEPYVFDWNW